MPLNKVIVSGASTAFWCWQKGGFQKGGFGRCSPGTKTRTRVRSPKPPFYETALLSPSEKLVSTKTLLLKHDYRREEV